METIGEIAKYALDRVAVGAGRDLENLVIILIGEVGRHTLSDYSEGST